LCPTPTATAANCSTFDFNAYFDCDYEPVPTPSVSIPCDDVNFDVVAYGVTPTPSATEFTCQLTGVDFSMSGYTPAVSPTITLTPTLTLSKTVEVQGQVSFTMLDEVFSCVSTKVLIDCETGDEYYTSDTLIYEGIPVVVGMIMLATITGKNACVSYDRDDTNISSNSNVDIVLKLYSECQYCSTLPTPTPTITQTPTTTPQVTSTPTSTYTPTQTQTQTQSATINAAPPSTPPATPPSTPASTPASTPVSTQTATPNWVYVYESCAPLGRQQKITQVIQTFNITNVGIDRVFQDYYNRCWKFIGRFGPDYIAPPTVTTITFNGNYFSDATIIETYNDCATCQLPPLLNYYELSSCEGVDIATTRIAPPDPRVSGQLYILPQFIDGQVQNIRYGYTGSFNEFRYPPTSYNGSIQKATDGLTCSSR
jgi:hypothetical protein